MEASPRFSLSRGLCPRAPGDKPARVFRAQTAALRLLGDPLLCQALNEIISDSLSQRPIHTGRARVTAVAQVQSRGGELPHARVRPEEKEPADQDPADCAKPSPRHASVQLRGLSAGRDCGVSRPRDLSQDPRVGGCAGVASGRSQGQHSPTVQAESQQDRPPAILGTPNTENLSALRHPGHPCSSPSRSHRRAPTAGSPHPHATAQPTTQPTVTLVGTGQGFNPRLPLKAIQALLPGIEKGETVRNLNAGLRERLGASTGAQVTDRNQRPLRTGTRRPAKHSVRQQPSVWL